MDQLDLNASLYQPTFLFVKNGRKLPNCPEPGDPWQCFLRNNSEFGIVAEGIGGSPDAAVMGALYNRPGVGPAMNRLGHAIDDLLEALRCQSS